MKIKAKQIPLIVPTVIPFDDIFHTTHFAETLNQMIHGKSKIKFEILGKLNYKVMVLFYFTRNSEFHSVKKEFKELIEREEVSDSS